MEILERARTLSIVLAGGEGTRLRPLTLQRAKPAVPFGGHYRMIDFALSNLANGGYKKIVVLTQYKSHSLDLHVSRTWRMSTILGNYVTTVPAQMRRGPKWFQGSADAVYQNFNLLEDEKPDYVFVFGADHIYRIDPRQLLDHHIAVGAGVTVAAIRVPIEQAHHFGIIEMDANSKITRFREKPTDPVGLPDDPSMVLASMGNYVFSRKSLHQAVLHDAANKDSTHDIGGNLIPDLVNQGDAYVYDFTQNRIPGAATPEHYWRDVGTLESYYAANMDLVAPVPKFDLYNPRWPIHTLGRATAPAKFVQAGSERCDVANSLISGDVMVSGGTVHNSVLSPGVNVEAGAMVEESILLDDVRVGPGAVIHKAIIDKNVVIPPGAVLSTDTLLPSDTVVHGPQGIVAIGKGTVLSEDMFRTGSAPTVTPKAVSKTG